MKKILIAALVAITALACADAVVTNAGSGRFKEVERIDTAGYSYESLIAFCDNKTGHMVYVYKADNGGGVAVDSKGDCRQ
jgi:opacity protein-like surface antigen